MAKSVRIHLVAPEQLANEAKQAANDKGVSLSEYIKDLIKIDVEKRKTALMIASCKEASKENQDD